MAVLYQPCV